MAFCAKANQISGSASGIVLARVAACDDTPALLPPK